MKPIVLGEPVRFLSIEWREDWEFDHPTCLLYPIVRYSPNGNPSWEVIEEACIDICLDAEDGKTPEDEDVSREFTWRRWSLGNLRRCARGCINGKRYPKKRYHVLEQVVVFNRNDEYHINFDITSQKAYGC